MIEILAPSASPKRGFLEHITLSYTTDVPALIEFRNVLPEGSEDLREQAELARENVVRFVAAEPWKRLVERDLSSGRITIAFAEEASRHQSSFGLAFLVGMLGLCMDLKVSSDQAFTGSLAGDGVPVSCTSNLMRVGLLRIGGLAEKAIASLEGGCCRLYYPFHEDDPDVLRAEYDVATKKGAMPFSLGALSLELCVSSLVSIAFTPESIWRRAANTSAAPKVAIELLHAMRESRHDFEFPDGVESVIPALRKSRRLTPEDERRFTGEFYGWWQICPVEKREKLLKAMISVEPTRPLDFDLAADMSDTETDIGHWLKTHSPVDLRASLSILQSCAEIAVDFSLYRRLPTRIAEFIVGHICAVLDQTDTATKPGDLRALLGFTCYELIPTLLSIVPHVLGPLERMLHDLLEKRLDAQDDANRKAMGLIHHSLTRLSLAKPVLAGELPEYPRDQVLRTEFSSPSMNDSTNALVATFNLGSHCEQSIQSPALLFDSCLSGSPFNRRRRFAYADDPTCHWPADVMQAVQSSQGIPIKEIGYRHRRGGFSWVTWMSDINPWPPSIDAQLFTATFEEHADKLEPKSMIDVGTGTGYLAITAKAVWPSIQAITLVEPQPLSFCGACRNVERALGADHEVIKYMKPFDRVRFRGQCDLLICSPPYLPERPLVPGGIEMATNGTMLLQQIVQRGAQVAREVWVSFSALAWPEFRTSLARTRANYRSVEILRRCLAVFRIPWLEHGDDDSPRTKEIMRYRSHVLEPRGLLDLDSQDESQLPEKYIAAHDPSQYLKEMVIDRTDESRLFGDLARLRKSSRESHGYRYWHEVRVVRMISA